MESVIRLEQVTKRFGDQAALDQVSFEVPAGSIFALLGENGAGKTTALRILLGLIEPTAGKATVLGLDPQTQGIEVRQRVGYLPEQLHLYDWMTVGEIGQFTAAFYDRLAFTANFTRVAAELGLPLGKTIKSLSKGTRAKVGLTLALAQDPALLMLDEPTSGLDLLVRREILDRMVDLAATGHTVLLSSHQIPEVERVADYVAILHLGRVAVVEPLDELKRSAQELIVTLHDGLAPLPEVAGQVLRQRRHARQWEILVRDAPPEFVSRLQNDPQVSSVEVRPASLEDIVASYLQRSASGHAELVEGTVSR